MLTICTAALSPQRCAEVKSSRIERALPQRSSVTCVFRCMEFAFLVSLAIEELRHLMLVDSEWPEAASTSTLWLWKVAVVFGWIKVISQYEQ